MSQLANQVAIVTGAGRGIGRAIALKFAAEGADVVCVSRTAENSEKVAAEVRALGRKAWAHAVDVSDRMSRPSPPPPRRSSPRPAAPTSS
jgi:7-alpha-hydroxysteroid dehydrogenase